MDLKTCVPVALYRERGFKRSISPSLNKIVADHKHHNNGQVDFLKFNREFSPMKAANMIYNETKGIEQYNRFHFKKRLFLKEIAYVAERHILYLLYSEFEKQEGRKPKPYKNWAHQMLYNIQFLGTTSLYEYKINEAELVDELSRVAKNKGLKYVNCDLMPVPNITIYQYNGHGYDKAGKLYDHFGVNIETYYQKYGNGHVQQEHKNINRIAAAAEIAGKAMKNMSCTDNNGKNMDKGIHVIASQSSVTNKKMLIAANQKSGQKCTIEVTTAPLNNKEASNPLAISSESVVDKEKKGNIQTQPDIHSYSHGENSGNNTVKGLWDIKNNWSVYGIPSNGNGDIIMECPICYTVADSVEDCKQFENMKHTLSNGQIVSVMGRHNYNELNAAIIANNKALLDEKYEWVCHKGGRMDANRADCRSALSYKCSVVCGWIMDDYIMDCINNWFYEHGYPVRVSANGTDWDRVLRFDDNKRVTNDPDYKFTYKGREILVEECSSYTGLFTKPKNAVVSFRNKKRQRMLEHHALVLCVETGGKKGYWNWRYILLGEEDLKRYNVLPAKKSPFGKESEVVPLDNRWAVGFDTLCEMLYLYIMLDAGEDIRQYCPKFPISCMSPEYRGMWPSYIRTAFIK